MLENTHSIVIVSLTGWVCKHFQRKHKCKFCFPWVLVPVKSHLSRAHGKLMEDVWAWEGQVYINIQMNIHSINFLFSSSGFLCFLWLGRRLVHANPLILCSLTLYSHTFMEMSDLGESYWCSGTYHAVLHFQFYATILGTKWRKCFPQSQHYWGRWGPLEVF